MPRPPLSANEVRDFRERIAVVAGKLFAVRGYDAVTMRAVADALDVSPMTLYRYVTDKDELLTLVRTQAFRQFADGQERAYRKAGAPLKRLRALGEAYVSFALDRPDSYRIMFQLDQSQGTDSPLLPEVRRSFSSLLRAMEEAIAAGVAHGDPKVRAHLAWAQMHGIVSLHLAGKLRMGCDIHTLIAELVDDLAAHASATKRTPKRTTSAKP